jgi:hypothetical protein
VGRAAATAVVVTAVATVVWVAWGAPTGVSMAGAAATAAAGARVAAWVEAAREAPLVGRVAMGALAAERTEAVATVETEGGTARAAVAWWWRRDRRPRR